MFSRLTLVDWKTKPQLTEPPHFSWWLYYFNLHIEEHKKLAIEEINREIHLIFHDQHGKKEFKGLKDITSIIDPK